MQDLLLSHLAVADFVNHRLQVKRCDVLKLTGDEHAGNAEEMQVVDLNSLTALAKVSIQVLD